MQPFLQIRYPTQSLSLSVLSYSRRQNVPQLGLALNKNLTVPSAKDTHVGSLIDQPSSCHSSHSSLDFIPTTHLHPGTPASAASVFGEDPKLKGGRKERFILSTFSVRRMEKVDYWRERKAAGRNSLYQKQFPLCVRIFAVWYLKVFLRELLECAS